MDVTSKMLRCHHCLKAKSYAIIAGGFSIGFILMYFSFLGKDDHHQFGRLSIGGGILQAGGGHPRGLITLGLQEALRGYVTDADSQMCDPFSNSSSACDIDKNPSTNVMSGSWDDLQLARRTHVHDLCQSFYPPNRTLSNMWPTIKHNENIIVDPRHKVLYCSIPKAACSSWRAAFALLTNKLDHPSPSTLSNIHFSVFMKKIGLPAPRYLSKKLFTKAVDNFAKFLVVRHPLERLVSAYRDKFRTYNRWTRHFQLKYGRKIVLLYRGSDVTDESRENGHDVTFTEFLRFILDESVPFEDRTNRHWDTYQDLCHPCVINYDHVVKFETLNTDNDVILQRYFSVQNSSQFFPKRNIKPVPSKDIMKQYYSTVPDDLVRKVIAHYGKDIQMFGYKIPPELWPTS